MPVRMPYPCDVSGKEWAFVVMYLVLVYASEPGIWLRLVKPTEAKRGFVLLPQR